MRISSRIILYFIILLITFFSAFVFVKFSERSQIIKQNQTMENLLANIDKKEGITPHMCPSIVINYMKKNNIKITQEFLPLGSFPNGSILTSTKREKEQKIIKLDKYGFRNNNSLWDKDHFNMAILGDSVVFAMDIDDKNIFTNLLNYKSGSVLNLGCSGNGIFSNLAIINQILQKYSVDNIIVFINLKNDLTKDIKNEWDSGYYRNYTNHDNFISIFENELNYKKNVRELSIKIINSELKENLEKIRIDNLLGLSNLHIFTKNIYKNILAHIENKEKPNDERATMVTIENTNLFISFLDELKKIVKKKQTKVTFLIIPSQYRFTVENKYKLDKVRYTVNTAIADASFKIEKDDKFYTFKELEYGFDLVDLTTKIDNNQSIYDGYFTKKGHSFLSDFIFKVFQSNSTKLFKRIVFYNSLQNYTDLSYYRHNRGISITEKQYIDWYKSIKNYFLYREYDEFLLAPFFSYSIINNKCNEVIEIIELFTNTYKEERLLIFFEGLCEIKLDSINNVGSSVLKLKHALKLNISEIIPEMAKGAQDSIYNLENSMSN